MSRELKFRVWDAKYKSWMPTEDDAIMIDMTGQIYFQRKDQQNQHSLVADQKRFVITQYTGLKDKNGRELYEGDIILMPQDATMSHPTGESELCKVGMSGGAFGYWLCDRFESFLDWYGEIDVIDDAEIIGNMWETPEFVEII
jgi:uncharacterized phage protein (TIGR01671 family)